MFSFIAALLSLLLFSLALVHAEEEPCQCSFSSSDPTNCVVFGQLGDGPPLIPWSVASQECLDLFQIKDEAIDPISLANMFPNPDGSGGSISSFVNYLRFDDGSVASSIKAGFPQFYVESEMSPGKMVLKDEITVDGTTTACSSDLGGSQSDCYNAMKTYFASEPGASEMAGVGQQLYNAAAVSKEKEQSLVRIRLCQEGGPTAECGALSDQMQQKVAENPNKGCPAFGLGPICKTCPAFPKCGGGTAGGTGGDDGSTSGSSEGGEDGDGDILSDLATMLDDLTSSSSNRVATTGGALLLVVAATVVKIVMSRENASGYTAL